MRLALAACLLAGPLQGQQALFPLAMDDGAYRVGGDGWGAEQPAPPFAITVPAEADALWVDPDGAGPVARLDVFVDDALTERFYVASIALPPSDGPVAEAFYEAIGGSVLVQSITAVDPDAEWMAADALRIGLLSVGAFGAYEDGNGNLLTVRVVAFAEGGAERAVMAAGVVSAAELRPESVVDDLRASVTWRMIDSITLLED